VSSIAIRPGIAQGAYPERRDDRAPWADRAVHVVRGVLARWRGSSRTRLEAFVRSVEREGSELSSETDEKIAVRVQDLRRQLVIEGLTEALVARSFAIVREVAERAIGMSHYDVQLMGGWVMTQGMLAEMETGEGKTLTATLPACTAALAGIPVHVISVNDYLVQRDADAMRPIYAALGLSVGTATEGEKDPAARLAAYACDVTYATSKVVAFDYLRDGLSRRRQGGPTPEPLLLRGLCFAIVDEADSVLADEARTPLILSGGDGQADRRTTYKRALRLARALDEGADFGIEGPQREPTLTQRGEQRLEELARPLKGFWTASRHRTEWVCRALSALHVFARDRDYLVRDGVVEIIDQSTGRAAPDRSWERGLHQLIELKEQCDLTPERETLAKISYQQFFRRYLRLAGMSGTAREVARELWSVYRLHTFTIPTRVPVQRQARGTRVFGALEAKWAAVVRRVREVHQQGRPVLVGTCSVAASEELSRRLTAENLAHQLLNARQDANEANIVAEAGRAGRITVATNMAGRGTDIKLDPGVAERGGLHVIATQRGDAKRIDRQLYGRCGRQGDPGSHEDILSLEDEPVLRHYGRPARRLMSRMGKGNTPIARWLGGFLTRLPQRAEEKRHAQMRRGLVDLEEHLGDLLAFSGHGE
jgi:preprotein translocase subunit SecA